MPTYGYHCIQCKHSLDAFQKMTDKLLLICPQCGHETLRRGPGGGIGVSFTGKSFSASTRHIETEPSGTKPPGCCPCKKSEDSCSDK
ncbi:MAG: zinc ribbon domain-containing protein [Parachlamydiaceae bacterium]|nr:zinc ribbon domain-containing protein [Parachlamydiaceae bacterium]